MKKVYDCFTFLNEFDILKLRLAELSDYVDYFVLVEAPYTFAGEPKPLHYKENPITGYNIIHVVVEDFEFPDLSREVSLSNREAKAFVNEWHQRDAGFRMGTANGNASDIVLASDSDEIVRPSKIRAGDLNTLVCYEQLWYNYYLNCLINRSDIWRGTGRGTVEFVQKEYMGGQCVFFVRGNPGAPAIADGGWHFSFMGGKEAIREKLKSFSHAPLQHLANDIHIDNCLANVTDVCDGILGERPYKIVDIDESMPKAIQDNPKAWSHMIYKDDSNNS